MNASRNKRNHKFSPPIENEWIKGGMPSQPPAGGLKKSVTVEQQLPKPGKAVEEQMDANMPDRK